MTVLVVDDEHFIMTGLVSMIKNFDFAGVNVAGYCNSLEALNHLKDNATDLVILDINMPQMSGLDLIRSAREINCKCKFVILSGYRDFEYAQQAVKLRVTEYLVKPVDENELYNILREAFRGIHKVYPEEYYKMSKVELEIFERIGNTNSKHLEGLLEYIHSNLQNDVSLTKLSGISGLHPNYISSLFIKELGMNYLKYVSGVKLVKALKILREDPEKPISDIALSLGYSNERQFYRMFKGLMGMPPGQYRESFQ